MPANTMAKSLVSCIFWAAVWVGSQNKIALNNQYRSWIYSTESSIVVNRVNQRCLFWEYYFFVSCPMVSTFLRYILYCWLSSLITKLTAVTDIYLQKNQIKSQVIYFIYISKWCAEYDRERHVMFYNCDSRQTSFRGEPQWQINICGGVILSS